MMREPHQLEKEKFAQETLTFFFTVEKKLNEKKRKTPSDYK
jgi:hypothetical protein